MGKWLSPNQAADTLNVHVGTIYRWLEAGLFGRAAIKVSRTWRIDLDAFEQWKGPSADS